MYVDLYTSGLPDGPKFFIVISVVFAQFLDRAFEATLVVERLDLALTVFVHAKYDGDLWIKFRDTVQPLAYLLVVGVGRSQFTERNSLPFTASTDAMVWSE